MEETTSAYSDVLRVGASANREVFAKEIYEKLYLVAPAKLPKLEFVNNDSWKEDFLKSALVVLSEKHIIYSDKETMWCVELDKKRAYKEIETLFSGDELPPEMEIYYEQFGFDALLLSVSKWINHDGVLENEYQTDRLWLGRYIDFLDKARQWVKWREADQSIARKKIAELKKIK